MDVFARVLLFTGVTVVVFAALSAVWLRGVFARIHYLSPVTSVGAPLIGLALGIENGWGLTTALDIVIVAVLAFAGPVVEVVTGRVIAQRENVISEESPQ